MKLLLDENLPHVMRGWLSPHEVVTVAFLGWSGVKNGELLNRAGERGFDAMITLDRGIEHQQNLAALPLSVVLLMSESNQPDDLRKLVPNLLQALESLGARRFVRVEST